MASQVPKQPSLTTGGVVFRIGLGLLGLFTFIFIGFGAVSLWIEVFANGAGSMVPTSGLSGRSNESPAILAAGISTFFSLVGAYAVIVVVRDFLRRRR